MSPTMNMILLVVAGVLAVLYMLRRRSRLRSDDVGAGRPSDRSASALT